MALLQGAGVTRWWSRPGMQLQAAVRTISLAPLGGGASVCPGQDECHVDGYLFKLSGV